MPSPTSSLSTQRPDLATFEEFDLEAARLGFIGSRVLPIIEVASQAGTFGKIPLKEMLQGGDTERAPGSGYNRGEWKFSTATYATQDNGWEEVVDDREAKMYASYFDAEQIAARRAFGMVLRSMEQRIADLVFNTTTFTGSKTTAVATAWSTSATATPITNVIDAMETVADRIGEVPNALILNWKKFNDLRMCDQVIDRITASGAGSPAKPNDITEQMLAQALGIEQVIVAGAYKNTANQGQTASLSQIWSSSYAMVCKVATSSDFRETCLGRTFHWSEDGSQPGGLVETYREENVRGEVVRVRHDVDEKLIYDDCGQLLTGV